MNRSWITALTLATVVGTGGAFVGVITASNEQPVAAAPEPTLPALAGLVDVTTPHLDPSGTVAYRLDSVGIVTVQVANGGLTVVSSVADPGWTAASVTGSGTHAEAAFTDGEQLVTFTADLSGSNVLVSVSSVTATREPQSATEPPAAAPASTSVIEPTPPTQPHQTVPTTQPTTPPTASHQDDSQRDEGRYDGQHTEPNDD